MAAKFTRLSHKIAIQLHLVAKSVSFGVLVSGSQSGNFWIHPRTGTNVLRVSSVIPTVFS